MVEALFTTPWARPGGNQVNFHHPLLLVMKHCNLKCFLYYTQIIKQRHTHMHTYILHMYFIYIYNYISNCLYHYISFSENAKNMGNEKHLAYLAFSSEWNLGKSIAQATRASRLSWTDQTPKDCLKDEGMGGPWIVAVFNVLKETKMLESIVF